ncbi:hypothetical protein GALMADRAFT_1133108 [Galerina marginata CBS 339.88]|uniref:Uncharacterized protein n=1 Tax=Galerina marginata (strain CBS 339.88) TaxID=685588 RepID=A0A067S893_GALM3|nr:hypothetical protein GALMADRAFT_1133108 [Galerina marginata CBS 339.88]
MIIILTPSLFRSLSRQDRRCCVTRSRFDLISGSLCFSGTNPKFKRASDLGTALPPSRELKVARPFLEDRCFYFSLNSLWSIFVVLYLLLSIVLLFFFFVPPRTLFVFCVTSCCPCYV